MKKLLFLFLGTLFFISCDYFDFRSKEEEEEGIVAIVKTQKLFRDDIKSILPENYTKNDSTLLVRSFINNWALKQLLLSKAEKNSSLEEFIDSAFEINAPLGNELLSTIFYPKTPLHDGGVIIRKNKILCAGAFYPSSDKVDIPKSLGSRHRAAIGISEISDSLTIVISEQTGNVSIAYNGYLDTDINKQALLRYLERHLQN